MDPLKYVEELSNPDADPPQLHDLALKWGALGKDGVEEVAATARSFSEKELLPKKILPAHKGNFEQKKPLIVDRSSSGQQSRTALSNSATSDNFGGFFAGPVIAGPSKMHVRKRPLVHSPPHAACYPEPDRPYKPGLLDGPKNNSTYEEQYYPPQESPRQFKPGVLNGPTTVCYSFLIIIIKSLLRNFLSLGRGRRGGRRQIEPRNTYCCCSTQVLHGKCKILAQKLTTLRNVLCQGTEDQSEKFLIYN
ncbi:unnamed protein product [Gongylonema pulchrum]|uniref:Uncharacterized protein n=1 Tax=Gongylonema pulchrum TaxID=637853 RepID=A0A3P6R4N2_9BILA|nr:unnamed protein product [Gongylonema pulchrum]